MISRRSPFLLPLPDDRVSLCVYADETGFRYWNRSSDPMPIKTINMAGLQKWEETDDYIIYLDKDAVMTTVANYVTGTYDLFKERKADIDGSMELLRANDIEWTSEDDSKLLLDINKVQLERIANAPMTIEEEDFEPQTFETRAVPTTYECCFRVDKSSGEIYIGEGYENLIKKVDKTDNITVIKNDGYNIVIKKTNDPPNGVFGVGGATRLTPLTKYTAVCIKQQSEIDTLLWLRAHRDSFPTDSDVKFSNGYSTFTVETKESMGNYGIYLRVGEAIKNNIEIVAKFQITKTSTPKPFVKSIMPNGKLAFVTSATSETHSFLYKENVSGGHGGIKFCTSSGSSSGRETVEYLASSFNETLDKVADIIISKSMCKFKQLEYSDFTSIGITLFNNGITDGITNLKYANNVTNRSFKQLLIYKGNLTEAELKAENEKDIRLK